MCEIGNAFSEVVICRRFCPAGGQPFFQAFLRLPDHNPLKRLEAFFRVISSRRRRGAPHPVAGPASFYTEMQNTFGRAALVSPSSRLRNGNWNIVLRARVLGLARGTPPLTKIMQRRTHPSLSFPFFGNYPSPLPPRPPLLAPAKSPLRRPLSLLSLALSLSFVIFVPFDTVAVRKLK